MRELTSHKVNGLNDVLRIEVLDEPGPGNACHKYRVEPTVGNATGILIEFQKGSLGDTGYPNGLSNEALLAIVEDRLIGFQSGEYACRENGNALTDVKSALNWSRDRVARGVEGTSEK